MYFGNNNLFISNNIYTVYYQYIYTPTKIYKMTYTTNNPQMLTAHLLWGQGDCESSDYKDYSSDYESDSETNFQYEIFYKEGKTQWMTNLPKKEINMRWD